MSHLLHSIAICDEAIRLVSEHEWSEIPSLSAEQGRHAIRWMFTADAQNRYFVKCAQRLLKMLFDKIQVKAEGNMPVKMEAVLFAQAAIKEVFRRAHPELSHKLRNPMTTQFRGFAGLVTQPCADQWEIPSEWWDKAREN